MGGGYRGGGGGGAYASFQGRNRGFNGGGGGRGGRRGGRGAIPSSQELDEDMCVRVPVLQAIAPCSADQLRGFSMYGWVLQWHPAQRAATDDFGTAGTNTTETEPR